jgi:LPPG:FO 2-phospho-L-lactate transferase
MKRGRTVALCGGVGGAKLAYGLSRVLAPEELTIIVNTGDDFEHFGLAISPDIDTVLYTLAERANEAQGWGRADEQWTVMQELQRLGGENWFRLGDRDVALHLLRTQLLRAGNTLTQTTLEIARRLGVAHAILPMSDDPVRTIVHTDHGDLPFQHYFVRERCVPRAHGFSFAGAEKAQLSEGVHRALDIAGLRGIVLCPSNPYVSIAPMLAVPGMRERLRACPAPVVAVSPIVGGRALKGPAAKMMEETGAQVSALTVAQLYADFIDAILLDVEDAALAAQTGSDDPKVICAPTVMRTREDRVALAQTCLRLLDDLQP